MSDSTVVVSIFSSFLSSTAVSGVMQCTRNDGMCCAGLAGGEVPPCGGDMPQPVLQQPAQHRRQSHQRGIQAAPRCY